MLRGLDAIGARPATAGWWCAGRSGSGKSTLLAVLMAALRPRAGRYDVDGVPADARSPGTTCAARMAWLPQEAHVFASTMRANLALAAPRGGWPAPDGEARMRAALAATGLGGLLAGLPDGLDTPVGAGGHRRCRAASGAGWPRPGRCWPTATSCCWTSRPRTWTRRRPRRWSATCGRALAGRVVVCVTHDDDLSRPGDTVVHLDRVAERV